MSFAMFYLENRTSPTSDIAYFWRRGGSGYTARLEEAQTFSEREADLTIEGARGSHDLIKHRVSDVENKSFRAVNIDDLQLARLNGMPKSAFCGAIMTTTTPEQQRGICVELARAMFPDAVITDANSLCGVDIVVYDKPNETRSWYGFDPFTSAEDSRALVEWLATQQPETRRRFTYVLCNMMWERPQSEQMPDESMMELLACPLAIIALAACAAITEKQ